MPRPSAAGPRVGAPGPVSDGADRGLKRFTTTMVGQKRGMILRRLLLTLALAGLGVLVVALPAAARAAPPSSIAPGAPGSTPDWAPADKHGFGTSMTRASKVWFTLEGGELTEVYYPRLDTPSFRDLQFVGQRRPQLHDARARFHDPADRADGRSQPELRADQHRQAPPLASDQELRQRPEPLERPDRRALPVADRAGRTGCTCSPTLRSTTTAPTTAAPARPPDCSRGTVTSPRRS